MSNQTDIDELIKERLDQGIYKLCPNNCIVDKVSGCNYILCGCKIEFCWNCSKSKGNGPNQCPFGNAICNSH